MPNYRVYRDFLDAETHASLLAWTIDNEAKFKPTLVVSDHQKKAVYDPSSRRSMGLDNLGTTAELFRQSIINLVPTMVRNLRTTPFEPSEVVLELELVANNDGAFFEPHTDTFTGKRRQGGDRVLSAVYYFHAEPKAFSGGALRLYPFGGKKDKNAFVDVEPEQNTLLVFPSWALHQVLPVSCPSGRFADSRFNVNCWVVRPVPKPPDKRVATKRGRSPRSEEGSTPTA